MRLLQKQFHPIVKSNPINSTITTSKNVEKILPMALSQNMYEEMEGDFLFQRIYLLPIYVICNPIYIFFATRPLRSKELSTKKENKICKRM